MKLRSKWLRVLACSIVVAGCCWNYGGLRPPNAVNFYKISTNIESSWHSAITNAGNTWGVFLNTGTTSDDVGLDGARVVGTALYDNPYVLAAALPIAVGGDSGCDMTEQDIGFNLDHAWSTASTTPAGWYDVESVALHEFGHWHLLFHVMCPSGSVMVPKYAGTRRSLSVCDTAGLLASRVTPDCWRSMGACFGLGYLFGLFGFGDSLESNEMTIVDHTNELLQIIEGDPALSGTLDQLASSAPPPGSPPDAASVGLAIQAVVQARESASPSLKESLDEVDLLLTNYLSTILFGGL